MRRKSTRFNEGNDPRLYKDNEIDYILNMIRYRQKEFEKTDMIKPFYNKSLFTLETLMEEMKIPHIFDKVAINYSTVTVENTLKLLVRCKMMFAARSLCIEILVRVLEREDVLERMKAIVLNIQEENEMSDPQMRENIQNLSGRLN